MDNVELLRPMCILGLAYLDWCLVVGDEMIEREASVQRILFPRLALKFQDDSKGEQPSKLEKWRNAKCDVQAMWCHLHYGGDIFVTRDKVFHQKTKMPALVELGAGRILSPEDALVVLRETAGEGK